MEGATKLNNGGMIAHLRSLHKDQFTKYKEAKRQGKKIDPEEETLRGTVPLFSLKNHAERKQYKAVQSSTAANYCRLDLTFLSIDEECNTLPR